MCSFSDETHSCFLPDTCDSSTPWRTSGERKGSHKYTVRANNYTVWNIPKFSLSPEVLSTRTHGTKHAHTSQGWRLQSLHMFYPTFCQFTHVDLGTGRVVVGTVTRFGQPSGAGPPPSHTPDAPGRPKAWAALLRSQARRTRPMSRVVTRWTCAPARCRWPTFLTPRQALCSDPVQSRQDRSSEKRLQCAWRVAGKRCPRSACRITTTSRRARVAQLMHSTNAAGGPWGHSPCDDRRVRPNLADVGHSSATFGPIVAEFGPNFGQRWSKSVRIWPNSARSA